MGKSTKRQNAILAVLIFALIGVVAVMYGIKPNLDGKSEIEVEMIELQDELDEKQYVADEADYLPITIQQHLDEMNELTKNLVPLDDNEKIDAKVQKLFSAAGISAAALEITEPLSIEESGLVGKLDDDAYPSGIYAIAAMYSVSATYNELVSFIESANKDSSLYISSISFASELQYDENGEPIRNTAVFSQSSELQASISLAALMKIGEVSAE